ncbi:unnamed protein product [Musa acuminata subsp. burmannicoides]
MSESQDSISDKKDEDEDLSLDCCITCCWQDVTMVLLEQLCSVARRRRTAMVHEPRQALRLHGPDEVNFLVHLFWPELHQRVSARDSALYAEFCFWDIMALLVFSGQMFYYLGELNDSLSYALRAGPLSFISSNVYICICFSQCTR